MKWLSFVTLFLLVILTVGCTTPAGEENSALAKVDNTTDSTVSTVKSGQSSTPTPIAPFTPPNTPALSNTTPTGQPATVEPTATSLLPPTITPTPEVEQGAIPTVSQDPVPSSTDIARTKDLEAYGLQVYKENYCGICHKLDAAGTGGLFGPEQNGIGTTATQRIQDPNYTGTATTAAEYLRESIVNPQAYLVEGFEQSQHHMPAFAHLSEDEVNALVQMLLQQQ